MRINIVYFFASRFKRWAHKHGWHKMEQNRHLKRGYILHWCHWCGLRGETADLFNPAVLKELAIRAEKEFDFVALQQLRKDSKY